RNHRSRSCAASSNPETLRQKIHEHCRLAITTHTDKTTMPERKIRNKLKRRKQLLSRIDNPAS
ncbi:MAG: hypothetical protein ACRERW_18960, partial [Pseudomonas sp.]